jgi:hypothetical protein
MPVDLVCSGCRGQYAECSAGPCRECAEVLLLALGDFRGGARLHGGARGKKTLRRCGAGWTISSSRPLHRAHVPLLASNTSLFPISPQVPSSSATALSLSLSLSFSLSLFLSLFLPLFLSVHICLRPQRRRA